MATRTVISLYLLASLLVAGSYGMILMLPVRMAEIGGDTRDVGRLQLLIGIVAIGMILLSGYVSDRIGQIRALGVAALSISLGLALFGAATFLGPISLAASVFYGLGWGLYFGLKLAVLARITTPESRFQIYALLSVAIMLGFGLWPVWGAVVTKIIGETPFAFYVASGLSLLGGATYQLLRQPIRHLTRPGWEESKDAITMASIGAIVRSPAVLPIGLTFLTACVFAGMNSFQTVYTPARALDFAVYFFVYTASAVGFRLILSPFFRPENAWWATILLYAITTGSVALFAFSGSNQLLYVIVAIGFGLGYGASSPVVQALGANTVPEAITAQSLQLLVVSHLVGVFGFPLIAGYLLAVSEQGNVILLLTILSAVATLGAIYGCITGKDHRPTPTVSRTHPQHKETTT